MDFTLELSNERTELNLDQDLPSSAGSFEAILAPTLDLSFLTYLKADNVNCALKNIQVDSAPLSCVKNEKLFFNLVLALGPSQGNSIYNEDVLIEANKKGLVIKTTDFQADSNISLIDYFNTLLDGQLNSYIIARYLQVVCDDHFFKGDAFENLDFDNKNYLSFNELNLLLWYSDCAKFTRLTVISYLNQSIAPNRSINELIDRNTLAYSDKKFSRAQEEMILRHSKKLRANRVENGRDRIIDITRMIEIEDFYDISFNGNTEDDIQKRENLMNRIREKTRQMAISLGIYEGRGIIPQYHPIAEKIIQANLGLLKVAKSTIDIINHERSKQERELSIVTVALTNPPEKRPRLKTPASVFVDDFVRVFPDSSKQKCRFVISKAKILDDGETTFELVLPKYLSYKLGANKNEGTGDYEQVRIGPISSLEGDMNSAKSITSSILFERQRLSSVMRSRPRLICISSDIFELSGRAQEKDIFFSKNQDFITIYNQTYKHKDNDFNFIFKKNKDPPKYFKIERSKNILHGVKIRLTDENGECLMFCRNTISRITLGFRPSDIDD